MKLFKIMILIAVFVASCMAVSASEAIGNNTYMGQEVSQTSFNITQNLNTVNWLLFNYLPNMAKTAIGTWFKTAAEKILNEDYENHADDGKSGKLQKSNDEIRYELDKQVAFTIINTAWALVKGFMMLLYQSVMMLIFVFEMRLVLWVFVEVIPTLFMGLRDMIVSSIRQRTK